MPVLKYSKRALADLDEIAAYTFDTWGAAQTVRYIQGLRSVCVLLSHHPRMGHPFHPSRPTWHRFDHASHFILYKPIEGGVRIQRFVHQRRLIDILGL
jgi:plasmid stabilization system protein ParE